MLQSHIVYYTALCSATTLIANPMFIYIGPQSQEIANPMLTLRPPYYNILYSTILHVTILYCTALDCTILYYTVPTTCSVQTLCSFLMIPKPNSYTAYVHLTAAIPHDAVRYNTIRCGIKLLYYIVLY